MKVLIITGCEANESIDTLPANLFREASRARVVLGITKGGAVLVIKNNVPDMFRLKQVQKMTPTGYEVGMYRDIERSRTALESIADNLKAINTNLETLADATKRGGGLDVRDIHRLISEQLAEAKR